MSAPPDTSRTEHGRQAVVYGDDDRVEGAEHPAPRNRDIARRSVMAIATPSDLQRGPDGAWSFDGAQLQFSQLLCPDQRFILQPTGPICSSTLVAEDVVLTAGHCIEARDCPDRLFVFDWRYTEAGKLATIEDEDVYSCAEVLTRRLDNRLDFALVRLDRPVEGDRGAAEVRWADEPLVAGDALTLIGFPSGLPVKVADDGAVTDPGAGVNSFRATVDAFGGNSGSGIFDAEGQLAGILVAGQEDYVWRGPCRVVNELPDDTRNAEQAMYPARALEALCQDRPDHAWCLEGAGWCEACAADDDCVDGWRCDGTCGPECAANRDCRDDHRCVEGACRPRRQRICRSGDVWRLDSCGAAQRIVGCGRAELCRDGACVPCETDCAEGSRRCAGATPEICGTDARGCPAWIPTEPCGADARCEAGRCFHIPPDAAPPDMAAPDAAVPDAAPLDMAAPDAAPLLDAEPVRDAAPPDAAPDAEPDAAAPDARPSRRDFWLIPRPRPDAGPQDRAPPPPPPVDRAPPPPPPVDRAPPPPPPRDQAPPPPPPVDRAPPPPPPRDQAPPPPPRDAGADRGLPDATQRDATQRDATRPDASRVDAERIQRRAGGGEREADRITGRGCTCRSTDGAPSLPAFALVLLAATLRRRAAGQSTSSRS